MMGLCVGMKLMVREVKFVCRSQCLMPLPQEQPQPVGALTTAACVDHIAAVGLCITPCTMYTHRNCSTSYSCSRSNR